jgi:hypothetical protein
MTIWELEMWGRYRMLHGQEARCYMQKAWSDVAHGKAEMRCSTVLFWTPLMCLTHQLLSWHIIVYFDYDHKSLRQRFACLRVEQLNLTQRRDLYMIVLQSSISLRSTPHSRVKNKLYGSYASVIVEYATAWDPLIILFIWGDFKLLVSDGVL